MFRNPTADLIVVLVIVLLFLGPKRLPGLGKALVRGCASSRTAITGDSKDDDEDKPPRAPPPADAQPDAATSSGSGRDVTERESAEVSSERNS